MVACIPSRMVHIRVEDGESTVLMAAFEHAVVAADRLGGHCVLDWAAPEKLRRCCRCGARHAQNGASARRSNRNSTPPARSVAVGSWPESEQ